MKLREKIVVHFAGGGGSCTGFEMALGKSPDHAVNHDAAAFGMHRTNHPRTTHHLEDVFEVDPAECGPVGAAWFSPDCKHFSKAKGGKPLDKRIRGLILVMLRWAKAGSRVMFMENVEEIQTWGPLVEMWKGGEQGWYPDPEQRGRTWRAFLACMSTGIDADHPDLPFILEVLAGTVTAADCVRGFGYTFDFRELRACDYGAPTIRKRLFAIFRNDGKAIVWPKPTHADPQAPDFDCQSKLPWRTIAECIDWERPCPSIFLRGQAAKKARCKRPLATATLRRIAKGIERYVMKSARPFLVSLTHQGGDRIESIDTPANTITGAHRGEKALVTAMITEHAQIQSARRVAKFLRAHGVEFEGEFATVAGYIIVDIGMRMLTPRELYRAQGFPEEYVIDHATLYDPLTGLTTTRALTKEEQIRMCGNSVCPPVAAALVAANVPELIEAQPSRWNTSLAERRAA